MSVANTERPSGAWATPARANWYAGLPVRSMPSTRTVPDVGAISPDATRATVVLPAPFGPTRATASPGSIVSDTSNSARNAP